MMENTERKIRREAHVLKPLLDAPEVFTVDDFEDGKELIKAVRRLKHTDIIEVVGTKAVKRERCGPSNGYQYRYVNKYRLPDETKETLKEVLEEPSLPCGCRPHIYNRRNGEFGCRYCDEERQFDQETVMEAFNGCEQV